MSAGQDEALEVTARGLARPGPGRRSRRRRGRTVESCKRMADVGFDEFGEETAELRQAWRRPAGARGQAPARPAGSVRDLVLGPAETVPAVTWLNRPIRADGEENRCVEYPQTVGELTEQLREGGYLADRGLATSLLVSLSLHRPVLLEGEVGVGKTELAKVLAAVFGRRLIRLQCYEGIDTNQALYEWDYARQMLQIRALSERAGGRR